MDHIQSIEFSLVVGQEVIFPVSKAVDLYA